MKHALPLFAFALVLVPGAALADGPSEIVLAKLHAGFAAGSASIAMVHAHLHHALNCLVGPGGPGFDAAVMNPCAYSGHGAIPDSGVLKSLSLKAAADEARKGIAEPDLAKAQADAAQLKTMLEKAQ